MEPVTVLAVGTGTGDGGSPAVQFVETSTGRKDVVLRFISPVLAIAVSFAWMFLTVLIATMTAAAAAPDKIPFKNFHDLVIISSSVGLSGALWNLLKDLLTLITWLKNKFPLLSV